MSKAFTRDEGSPALELVRRAPTQSGPRPITPQGHARLTAEREALAAKRAEVKSAAAFDAAMQLAELDARLALLDDTLRQVRVAQIDPASTRAFIGATVELQDEEGARASWQLVGPDEADAKAGRLSVESPLGRALLGKEAGEEVPFQRPRGRATYEILAVRYA